MRRRHRHRVPGERWLARARAALIPSLALLSVGCIPGLFGGARATIPLGTGTLAVLPFATPTKSYFESEVGARFSREIARLVREGCRAANVIDVDRIPTTIDGRPADELSVTELGRALGANYMVIGEIHDLRAKDPKTRYVLKGTMVISARAFGTHEGKILWSVSRRTVHYPPPIGGEEIPAVESDEEEVIHKVMREAAWVVAEVFRGPRDPDDEKYLR